MSANPHNTNLELSGDNSRSNGGSHGNQLPGHEQPGLKSGSQLAEFSAPASVRDAAGHEALQALLAFSSLHEQIRQRRLREKTGGPIGADVWQLEQFVLDEVLQLVAERALTLTDADGVAIAMAEDDSIVCRAAAGQIVPELGARLDPKSGISGACLRTGGIVRCDDSEKDSRVDVEVCRSLGTRSMVAVPIASAHGILGLLEAFSGDPYGFNDSDVRSLNLLAELILAAMKPEEENRLAEISQRLVEDNSIQPAPQDAEIEERGSLWGATDPLSEPVVVEPGFVERGLVEPVVIGPSLVEPSLVEPQRAPELFQVYGGKEKRSWLLPVLMLAGLGLAASAGLWWWKTQGSVPASVATTSPVPAASEKQPEPAPVAPLAAVPATPSSVTEEAPSQTTEAERPSGNEQTTEVTGIWHLSSPNSSTVIIDMKGEVQYEAHRLSSPERIYFDLHDTSLAPGMFGKTIEIGDANLERVRIAQPRKGVSRVVLETTGTSDFSVSLKSNPYRLVVEIRKAGSAERHAAADSPGAGPEESIAQPLRIPESASPDKKIYKPIRAGVPRFRLALDAGHGGWDLGTVGRKGLMEKDLVLDIVQRLGKLAGDRLGADVIYTRQDDSYLPLEKRTEVANLAQADLFISVHANYSEDTSARGSEIYYTNTYSSLRARTADADVENATPENANWNNVDIREKVQKSHRFAVAVQQSLYRMLSTQIPQMRDRGVKKASYVVLTGTSMPAILAEVSFVSSPADESKLLNPKYRQKIAVALYKGIAQYTSPSRGVNVASTVSKPVGLQTLAKR
jgi:N-acetylmuramoyl-L-alanine amidase/putative methionine-R-sulfoxide reductase with GAF domain